MQLGYCVRRVPTIHNAYWSTREEALNVPLGDINLHVDPDTGLVVNSSHSSDLCQYDTTYTHDEYTSSFVSQHLQEMAHIVVRSVDCLNIHEIGAGNGLFAAALAVLGARVSASDPSVSENHQRVIKARYEDLAPEIYSALVLRHVLEHIPSPFSYVNMLKSMQRDQGSFFFEYPSWDYITENDAWFDVTYEHVNYFSKSVSSGMFGGRCVAERVARGQYGYVTGRVADFRVPVSEISQLREAAEAITRLSHARLSSQSRLRLVRSQSKTFVVWGAAQKGAMIVHAMNEVGIDPDFIVDVDVRKQGRYLGGGYLIAAPDVVPATKSTAIIVSNSNYVSEIRSLTQGQCRYFVLEKELTEV
jgi:hypothetical protein